MGCRTHKWRSHSVEPNVSGKRLTLRLKSVKSEDINALRDNLPLNYDSDSEEGFDEPVSVKDMFIASQIVRCAPKDHYPAVRIRHLERKYRRKEFRLPKLQCMDLMVSMTQMSVSNPGFDRLIWIVIDWSELYDGCFSYSLTADMLVYLYFSARWCRISFLCFYLFSCDLSISKKWHEKAKVPFKKSAGFLHMIC